MTLVLRNLRIVPMDGTRSDPVGSVRAVDLRIVDGTIAAITGPGADTDEASAGGGDAELDCTGLTATPGFVQGHVHFCQTLFRGLADDRPLLAWLRERIWPLEAAHDAASTRASAELSLLELLRGGTTAVQAMESVRHAEEAFTAAERAGITAIIGNCLMDVAGDDVPPGLPSADAREAMRTSEQLADAYDGRGRLHYAVSPRFVLSCSDELSHACAAFARERDLRVHTHCAEHPDEVATVARRFGKRYVHVLEDLGQLGEHSSLAHCVHTDAGERERLHATGTGVLHCPSANLKLGSGIAPIADYAERGIRLALGADGAPCNNRLSALTEIRTAALLQAVVAGPGRWPAARALALATCEGARTLGLDDVGRITVGARADLVLFALGENPDDEDPVTRIVYASDEREIRHVLVGGELVVRSGEIVAMDPRAVRERARVERRAVLGRAGLAR